VKMKERINFDSQRKELLQEANCSSSRDITLDLAESGSLDRCNFPCYLLVGFNI